MSRLTTLCAAGALAFSWAAAGQSLVGSAVAGEDNHPLKAFLKTAPKAPDAWCQRHALNEVTAQWRARRVAAAAPTTSDVAKAPVAANEAATCNPDYRQRLSLCALPPTPAPTPAPAAARPDDTETAFSGRLRACMSDLAAAKVKPAL